ncbi:class I SAM-dependent methyltransferase [Acinetobacter sp. ANC 3781]
MGHIYKESFFNYIDFSSSRSATAFIKCIDLPFKINTVLDVGCGRGAWLAQWAEHGKNIYGVDGAYVNKDNLLISNENFDHQDISKPFDLGEKYDLVQCLEVAEHLQEKDAVTLIDNLIRHGDFILFSAAIPGQGGEFHVNEQPLNYWVNKFSQKGYSCFDYIRPQILKTKKIEPWYRYNSILFIKNEKILDLETKVKKTKVDGDHNFNQLVSFFWLTRNLILRFLPDFLINAIAKIKHYLMAMKK